MSRPQSGLTQLLSTDAETSPEIQEERLLRQQSMPSVHAVLHDERESAQPVVVLSDPLNEQIRKIDYEHANLLVPTQRRSALWQERYGKVPIFNDAPIYRMDQGKPNVFEQALRDFGSIYLINHRTGTSVHIHLNSDFTKSAHDAKALDFYNFGPRFHELYKTVKGYSHLGIEAAQASADAYPHLGRIPIFLSSVLADEKAEIADGQLFNALRDSGAFYYVYPSLITRRVRIFKFNLDNEGFFWHKLEPQSDEETAVRKAFTLATKMEKRYGKKLASVTHGRPIQLGVSTPVVNAPKLAWTRIPRFDAQSVTREQMVDAIQKHGKFRLYDAATKEQKETLVSMGTFDVRPLSGKERFLESIGQKFGRIHLP